LSNKKKCLKLLVIGSAVTVPMISLAENKVAVQAQYYQENDDRIEVQDGKLLFEHDFGTDHTINMEYDWDSISGASPTWDSVSGASQTENSDAVSGPSPCIDEDGNYYDLCRDTREKDQLLGDGHKQLDDFDYKNIKLSDKRDAISFLYTFRTPKRRNELNLGASYSKESDFENTGVSADYLMYMDHTKNRSLSVGASFMNNDVYDYLENKWESFDLVNAEIGFTQVINARAVGKVSLFYLEEDGHLSNPYFNVVRLINVMLEPSDPAHLKYYLARDSRPNNREAGGFAAQYSQALQPELAVQLSYRYYQDSWSVQSHTLEGRAFYDINEKFRIGPILRLYDQSAANFFKAHDASNNVFGEEGYASVDHRLGKYNSWTTQLRMDYRQSRATVWNVASGYQSQSSGLEFMWINFGIQYHY